MKKPILLLAICLSLGIVFISCKGEKKEETEKHESHAAEKADLAMADVYQCPMDCEKGKTYDKEGACPECKMDLKKVEKEGKHEHEDGEKHDSKEGGGEDQEEKTKS